MRARHNAGEVEGGEPRVGAERLLAGLKELKWF